MTANPHDSLLAKKEWTEAEERALRYRINVATTSKGAKSFDCTVEGTGFVMAEILERSDELVRQLEIRYPAPKE